LLAFGCVVFTTCAVAVATHYLLKFDWAIGFLLGAIIAPPDVVAPLAIARRLALPRRLLVVLEGEGLANDATALILYRFAVAAAVTGTFSLPQAAGTFTLIVIGEILFGIAVGWLSLRLRQWAREPRVEITLSLMTPYLAFWVPEHLGGSGVLATVACGLYVSWNGPETDLILLRACRASFSGICWSISLKDSFSSSRARRRGHCSSGWSPFHSTNW
jgi:CPA1 family monovalent cation:H+ antiporter